MSIRVAAYGGGTNSTAMLIGCAERGINVDAADTGGERPRTYGYIDLFSDWLERSGLPRIFTVKRGEKTKGAGKGLTETLEEAPRQSTRTAVHVF